MTLFFFMLFKIRKKKSGNSDSRNEGAAEKAHLNDRIEITLRNICKISQFHLARFLNDVTNRPFFSIAEISMLKKVLLFVSLK